MTRLRSKSLLVVDGGRRSGLPSQSICPAAGRQPSRSTFDADADDLVRGEKAVVYPLPEGIGVDRIAEVLDVGNSFGFFRRCGQADLGGVAEIFENLAPGGISGGAAAVAFVDNDQVEEVGAELPVGIRVFIVVGQPLVEGEIDLKGLVDLLLADDRSCGLLKCLKSPRLVWSIKALRSAKNRMRFLVPLFHNR